MLWKMCQTDGRPKPGSGSSADGNCAVRLVARGPHASACSRRYFYLMVGRCTLALAASFIGGAAMAVPVPSASTSSKLDLFVSLSGLQLQLPLFSSAATTAQTATAATGLDPLGGLSGHFSSADSSVTIQPLERSGSGTDFSGAAPAFSINMQYQTLAESLWTGPMGARASASGSASSGDMTVTATPGATLSLDWIFGELRLDADLPASLSTVQHMVSVSLESLAAESAGPSVFQVGFSATARDGETRWTAYDIPGSTAISDWLHTMLASGTGQSGYPLNGPTLTLPLYDGSSSAALPREVTIAVEVSHMEYSSEAPLAPVRPVGEQAGAEETGAMTHWDAAQRRLSFDQFPLNIFLDASGSPIRDDGAKDPLATARLEIDPLVYIGDFNQEGHFVGTGGVRLVAQDGEILFETELSGLVYDERLYELEGFNLFGPLLSPPPAPATESRWLTAFHERTNGRIFYLPELFIDIGLPAATGSPGERWSSDFSVPANATLSFAGPALVALPGSAALLLLGLVLLMAFSHANRASIPVR